MSDKQRSWGQYDTSPDLVDLLLGFCMRRPGDRLLDPSCGRGEFLRRAAHYQRWLADTGSPSSDQTLWGVDIDPDAVRAAQLALEAEGCSANVMVADFFSLRPDGESTLPPVFDCVVGNPPYTRSEWLSQVDSTGEYKGRLAASAVTMAGGQVLARLSKRAGLHAYFFVHGSKFLRPGGRFGFVVSNSWLDVEYGRGLKEFLLAHFKIIAIVESAVERWFGDTKVNTCLVVLERCEEPLPRRRHVVRFARLFRPLGDLMARPLESAARPAAVDGLVMRLLPGQSRLAGDIRVRVVGQGSLTADEKWGIYLRAPEVFFQVQARPPTVRLAEIAQIQRGQTTGANAFFYLTRQAAARWGIEPRFIRPLLKSPKELTTLRVRPNDLRHCALSVPEEPDESLGRNVLSYIQWGEHQGYHRVRTCARRPVWYRLPSLRQSGPRLACAKGVWGRHFALVLAPEIIADQQFYLIQVNPDWLRTLAGLLNSTWVAFQAELLGRSNLGQGVLWLAAYELSEIRLPDPRCLSSAQRLALESAWEGLADNQILPISEQVGNPAAQALDTVVFDLLGLAPGERIEVVDSAVTMAEIRMRRATGG